MQSRDILAPRILHGKQAVVRLGRLEPLEPYVRERCVVQRLFAEEVKNRQAERQHTLSLTHGQNYVLRELRVLFGATEDDDQKAMINVLEKALRGPLTRAVNKELNLLRRNGVAGQPLLKSLAKLYDQHNLRDWVDRRSLHTGTRPVPRIVCSEELV